jgi:pimeloyl-ACP methyl ester carboxylesterase
MDYHDSSAGNARLAVIKLAATANKLGTVFFNPGSSLPPSFVAFYRRPIFTGGPGGSGLQAALTLPLFSEYLQGTFDVISWDPRGVGHTLWVDAIDSW